MADAVIENAIKGLRQRRDELDRIIQALNRLAGGPTHPAAAVSAVKKQSRRKGKPMSAAAKAKLRAAYAANHPGWKPKK